MKLTDLAVKNLAVDAGQRTFFDDTLKGFGVRVSPKSKTFVLVIHRHNRNRWETLGKYPVVSLSKAREEARNRLSEVQLGQRSVIPPMTFYEAFAAFLTTYEAKNRPKSVYEMKRLVNRHLMPKFRHHDLSEIKTQDVVTIIDKLIPTHAECKALFTAARTLFRWMEKRRHIERSPISGLDVPVRSESRTNLLDDDELGKVLALAVADQSSYGRIVELLIRTGQRVKQIAHLRAEWINTTDKTITWPRELMKSNREHTIPYTDIVAAIFTELPKEGLLFPARGRETPFNGFSKSKLLFDKKLHKVSHYTLHDFRRNFSSSCAALQVDPMTVERILAHIIPGVMGIYNRYSFLPTMRDAMQKYERWLETLLPNTENTNAELPGLRNERA